MTRETASDGSAADGGEFDWLTLDGDEEILWSGKPHAYSLVPALVVGVPLCLVLVGIPLVVGTYLSRENTVYLLTTAGLYRKRGVLSRDVQKIEFEKVQNISFSQGALGKAFGYGNVDISTAGGSGVEMRFRAIPDPKDVQERINRQSRRARSRTNAEGGTGREPDAVLDDILTELRAIRAAVEGDAPGDGPTDGSGGNAMDEGSNGGADDTTENDERPTRD